MELVGTILYFVGKGLFYFFKYTLPIWLVILAIILASTIGGSKIETARQGGDWAYEKRDELTHSVTVCWTTASGQTQTTAFEVREDRVASIEGGGMSLRNYPYSDARTIYAHESIFFNSDPNALGYCVVRPVEAGSLRTRKGYRLLGFFNTPYGGEMYFNAGGYAVRTIDEDITVYAVYEPIADPAS